MEEAQRYISAAEFAEWKAFDRGHPIGWERFDILAAQIAQTTANVWTKSPKKLGDFIIEWGPKRVLTVAEVCAKGEAYLASLPKGMVIDHGSDDREAGSLTASSDG